MLLIPSYVLCLQTYSDVCGRVPGVGREVWEALFGNEDIDEKDREFTGFTHNEV